jgi:hypothetical protein
MLQPPAVGDIVSVSGRVGIVGGVVEMASARNGAPALSVMVAGMGGTVMGGAYAPAGQPIEVATGSAAASYAGTIADNHPSQVANVLHFRGPLSVTSTTVIFRTNRMGTTSVGYAITGGVFVGDAFTRASCPVTSTTTFPNGIRGVWERYQDTGAAQPGPVQPVLYPLSCADLMP